MKFGIVTSFGSASDYADMAREAEESGWDGVFAWRGGTVAGRGRRRGIVDGRACQASGPFEIVTEGITSGSDRPADRALLEPLAGAGASNPESLV